MGKYYLPLLPGRDYHIFSRAVGDEKLFRSGRDYALFLDGYCRYIEPVAQSFCWNLLPNHFHFLIRIREQEHIAKHFGEMKKREMDPERMSDFLMERFSNWLNSYAKSVNKKYNRRGALFMDYMRRVEIVEDRQFGATVFYIHKNPVHHGYCRSLGDWAWSSFREYESGLAVTELAKETLRWFGGREGFLQYHSQPVHLKHAVVIE